MSSSSKNESGWAAHKVDSQKSRSSVKKDPLDHLYTEQYPIVGHGVPPTNFKRGGGKLHEREQIVGYDRSGSGTLQDPEVMWGFNPSRLREEEAGTAADVEEMCRAEAKRLGFQAAVIRSSVRDKMVSRDHSTGSLITTTNSITGEIERVMEDADPHVTVMFGISAQEIQMQGHIFVTQKTTDSGVGPKWIKMDDPKTQRKILKVLEIECADEYWLLPGATQPSVPEEATRCNRYKSDPRSGPRCGPEDLDVPVSAVAWYGLVRWLGMVIVKALATSYYFFWMAGPASALSRL